MTDSTRCGGKKKIPVQEFGASTFWESCKGCVDCTPDPGVDVEKLIYDVDSLLDEYGVRLSDAVDIVVKPIRRLAAERDRLLTKVCDLEEEMRMGHD